MEILRLSKMFPFLIILSDYIYYWNIIYQI